MGFWPANSTFKHLRDLIKSLQEENARQAAVIKAFQTSSSRRLDAKDKKKSCFDFKYIGGCTAGSTAFCSKLKATKSVDGNAVRKTYVSGGNCGLSFDSKNWNNLGILSSWHTLWNVLSVMVLVFLWFFATPQMRRPPLRPSCVRKSKIALILELMMVRNYPRESHKNWLVISRRRQKQAWGLGERDLWLYRIFWWRRRLREEQQPRE